MGNAFESVGLISYEKAKRKFKIFTSNHLSKLSLPSENQMFLNVGINDKSQGLRGL